MLKPSEVSRSRVCVALRVMTSTSPDCRATKRCCAVVGVNFDLLGVAEHRRGDRLAEIDVEAGPLALAVGEGEARQAGVDRALHEALGLDRVEGLAGPCGKGGDERKKARSAAKAANDLTSICEPLSIVAQPSHSAGMSHSGQAKGAPPGAP